MRKLLFILLTIAVLTISTLAHPGRTDQYGGHFNRSTGEYHYHSYHGVDKPGYPYPGGAEDTPTITYDPPKSYEPEKSYTPPSVESAPPEAPESSSPVTKLLAKLSSFGDHVISFLQYVVIAIFIGMMWSACKKG